MMAQADKFEKEGRLWLRSAITPAHLEEIGKAASHEGRPGARIGLKSALSSAVAASGLSQKLRWIWPGMQLVRIVSFDKSSASNWSVPWHQDRLIAMKSRHNVEGYSNWSEKGDVWHCEPPLDILQNMLFVRVHIDKSVADNGAMECALLSHRAGKLPAELAGSVAAKYEPELSIAEPGDVLVLPMLTLHRSGVAKSSEGRRAIRLDYCSKTLSEPMEWAL